MINIQYDLKRRALLKELYLRLRKEGSAVQPDIEEFIEGIDVTGLLLITQILLNEDEEITIDDAQNMSTFYTHLLKQAPLDPTHPVSLFKQENALFQTALKEIWELLMTLEQDDASPDVLAQLQTKFYQLGAFHKHYHRKEKLLFPIFERYGHVQAGRMMWEMDDRIRALYMGLKRRIDQFSDESIELIQKRYLQFQERFEKMIYEEECILFPILLEVFNDKDWQAVAEESRAFGYAIMDVEETWSASFEQENVTSSHDSEEHLPFGGGFLTTKEANLILNYLPLEITFVDKNNLFKYFNEMTEASEMMLVRTPLSIGRNVANCHPPKSLRKVMTLMRDLISGKRPSESMWFKKNGQYIHLTYQALFDEEGEYVGILEYVQDIQPFLELPEEVKMGLSPID